MKDHQGVTALAKAVREEKDDCAALLRSAGAYDAVKALADAEAIRVAEAKAKADKAAADKAEADRSVLLCLPPPFRSIN